MREQTLEISNRKGVSIEPGMIGLFYEDINYACDGGISAQMLENGSFEFTETYGFNDHYTVKPDRLYGWAPYPTSGDGAVISIGTEDPVSRINPHYLKLAAASGQNGVMNKAYEGAYLRQGMTYQVTAYLRSADYDGPVCVSVLEGKVKQAQVLVSAVLAEQVTKEWKQYSVSLTAAETIRYGKFVLSLGELPDDDTAEMLAGAYDGETEVTRFNKKTGPVLEIDFVTMKPEDAVCGVFRKDLADLLKGLHPGFLRFPGGCIVEGNELSNRYRWKETVGRREDRRWNWNRWAVHENPENEFAVSKFSHYNQSYDIGYYEYFLLCEYIGAKALPVQHVGLACQYQTHQFVEPDSEAFDLFVQDVLDLIEFANGDVFTKWGALRAEMGHPAPFGLSMIGIGNEQWETEQVHFFERYTRFEAAIHAKYPEIRLIGSAGPGVQEQRYEAAWEFYHKAVPEKGSNFVYAVDEHYYRSPEWFLENTHFYDDYPRDIRVFAGEYAAHVSRDIPFEQKNTLKAALCEAAFLTGVVRNADVVALASYAPLFARLRFTQWAPDLIWFDDASAYGSPSYYVQKMFAHHSGSCTVESELDAEENPFFKVVSFDEAAGEYIVKFVNLSDEDLILHTELPADFHAAKTVICSLLCADEAAETAVNSPEAPEHVRPVKQQFEGAEDTLTIPKESFSVIRFSAE